ncbi:unnamed protein product [Aphanomyces euteiches]
MRSAVQVVEEEGECIDDGIAGVVKSVKALAERAGSDGVECGQFDERDDIGGGLFDQTIGEEDGDAVNRRDHRDEILPAKGFGDQLPMDLPRTTHE